MFEFEEVSTADLLPELALRDQRLGAIEADDHERAITIGCVGRNQPGEGLASRSSEWLVVRPIVRRAERHLRADSWRGWRTRPGGRTAPTASSLDPVDLTVVLGDGAVVRLPLVAIRIHASESRSIEVARTDCTSIPNKRPTARGGILAVGHPKYAADRCLLDPDRHRDIRPGPVRFALEPPQNDGSVDSGGLGAAYTM